MTFGSVCSGIEAASSAWHPLGWEPAWFAEIEPFPSAVLAHRWPGIPNHGDFTRLIKDQPASVDVLVGGTPCQSFSVAGLRGGLTDHRGNLALAFMALVDVLRPRWVVWENVPGVLSSNGGRDFGSILGALGQLGYGFAYRVLDAQYFGLAQRRKRVFVVGHLGDWRRAAAVLFEPEGVRWDSPPRRETGAGVAGSLGTGASGGGGWRVGADEAAAGQVVSVDLQNTSLGGDVAGTVDCSRPGRGGGQAVMAYGGNDTTGARDVATALNAKGGAGRMDFESETFVAHTLRGTGHDASEDGTGRGVPLVPAPEPMFVHVNKGRPAGRGSRHTDMVSVKDHVETLTTDGHSRSAVCVSAIPLDLRNATRTTDRSAQNRQGDGIGEDGDPCPTLTREFVPGVAYAAPLPFDTTQITSSANRSNPCHPIAAGAHAPAVAFTMKDHGADAGDISPTLRSGGHNKSHANGGVYPGVTTPTMGVRRLLPVEMEKLQGFPPGHTAIPWRGKPASECPDGPRAKALGNSMAVPCMAFIGRRILLVDAITEAA